MKNNIDADLKIPKYGNQTLVVINKKAGKKKLTDSYIYQVIKNLFNNYNLVPHFLIMTRKNITTIKKIIVENNISLLVIIGGDGTVRAVINEVLGLPIEVAIIPNGTFNHLAQDLGLPPGDFVKNLEIIVKGHRIKVDVAEVNGHYFLNNSSIGLYPQAVHYRRFYSWMLKWLATSIALLNVFKEFPVFHVRYKFENASCDVITPLVFIANNQYTLKPFKLAERSQLGEGKLYLYINSSKTRWQFLKQLYQILFRKKQETAEGFKIVGVEECELILNKKKVNVAMDGDILKLKTPLRYQIHQQKLTFITTEMK